MYFRTRVRIPPPPPFDPAPSGLRSWVSGEHHAPFGPDADSKAVHPHASFMPTAPYGAIYDDTTRRRHGGAPPARTNGGDLIGTVAELPAIGRQLDCGKRGAATPSCEYQPDPLSAVRGLCSCLSAPKGAPSCRRVVASSCQAAEGGREGEGCGRLPPTARTLTR